jgi:hypothetical protein
MEWRVKAFQNSALKWDQNPSLGLETEKIIKIIMALIEKCIEI